MNGVINFLKPPGMSSNGAVVYLRGITGAKTGHAGTLDPGACGVLPLCVGRATKISSYLMGGKKEYIAEISFGKSTDTGDSYGSIIKTTDKAPPDGEEVRRALSSFRGSMVQRTPAYSAVKHQGRKLYSLARQGEEVPELLRDIEIYETQYLMSPRPEAHMIRVVCGKGTYIRALCEDIGKSLGLPAYMSFLIRTKCAGLDIADAYTADELKEPQVLEKALLPMDMFLDGMPRIVVEGGKRKQLVNGVSVYFTGGDAEQARVYTDDEFIGIGCAKDQRLKITTLLTDG